MNNKLYVMGGGSFTGEMSRFFFIFYLLAISAQPTN